MCVEWIFALVEVFWHFYDFRWIFRFGKKAKWINLHNWKTCREIKEKGKYLTYIYFVRKIHKNNNNKNNNNEWMKCEKCVLIKIIIGKVEENIGRKK